MTSAEPSEGALLLAAVWLRRLWWESWIQAGRVANLRAVCVDNEREGRIEVDLLAVLARAEREGPLPERLARMQRALVRWCRRTRATVEELALPPRRRGRESRETLFLALMFKAAPDLPRSPGPWMRTAEAWGYVEPVDLLAPGAHARRRAWWRQLLRRSRRGRNV